MDNRQIDKLVAQYVMGVEISKDQIVTRTKLHNGSSTHWEDIPRYTINMAAAWLVWEWLEARGANHFYFVLGRVNDDKPAVNTLCFFTKEGEWEVKTFQSAETYPLAICLAALKEVALNLHPYSSQVKAALKAVGVDEVSNL